MKTITEFINESLNDEKDKLYVLLKKNNNIIIDGVFGKSEENMITQLAKKVGYDKAVPVYMDKMNAEDFAPIPTQKGDVYAQWWTNILFENPNKKYVVVFVFDDHIDRDVMNGLMPIVLNNKIGNKEIKNACWCIATTDTSKISKPLLDRCGGPRSIIKL